ncbi:MAG: S9 family peptidase [Ignavibacteriae bacterium]|nr:MAG: S9 family peptidase [Ignavibacteriota bacterium]
MVKKISFILLIALLISCGEKKIKVNYPKTAKVDTVDNYFGKEVPDPYRWLEDDNSEETKKWVSAQTKVTEDYLSQIPYRKKIEKRLTELWNYEKYSAPRKVADYYVFSKNDGLQEHSVIYIQKGLDAKPEVLLDPNKLSEDGSVSLAGLSFSNDGKYASYSISRGGSDWREIYVMNVKTKKLLDDHLMWAKFTGMAWYKNGFFYSRYDAPKKGNLLKGKNEFQKLYYHKLGDKQEKDKLILQNKKNPQLGFSAYVTDDEKYLIISGWQGSANENSVYVKDLSKNGKINLILGKFDAQYGVVDNIGENLIMLTTKDAPNSKLILVNPQKPQEKNWKEILPETENSLQSVSHVGGKLIAKYLKDANSYITVNAVDGKKLYDVKLPGVGTAGGFGGKKEDKEVFYTFTSFTYPPTIFRYNIEANKSELFRKSNVKFNPEDYETKQVFYKSKDGTKIPLFITYKKGLKLDGTNPTLLYAYGGFNISLTPSFSVARIPLLENDGVYALACLRGGGEYGEKWHKAGMLNKKQNVFDDFIAAAEYLIKEKYTSPEKLAIQGGSNGGLLIGAVINQRPELFSAAFPQVGVLDMLRFHKFTIGWAWVPEYGSSEDSTQFEYLYKYSPLHNINGKLNYPATMIATADHDDRVFPAHSFKYAAELQKQYKGENPILIRIETQAGHGAGTATSKIIELYTDIYTFMFYNLGVNFK